MKRIILLTFTLLAVSPAISSPAEDTKIDCSMWRVWNNEIKTSFLVGYSEAIGMMGFAAAAGGESPDTIQKVIHAMWPHGYNLGQLGDELDRLCPTPPFEKMRLNLVIAGVAAKVARQKK
jgi:hypothetical protein